VLSVAYSDILAVFGEIWIDCVALGPRHGFREGRRGRNWGPNPNKPIECNHSAINKMRPEWTEQTHGWQESRYEQVTATFVCLLAEFEQTPV
jgi:hypothetical protein